MVNFPVFADAVGEELLLSGGFGLKPLNHAVIYFAGATRPYGRSQWQMMILTATRPCGRCEGRKPLTPLADAVGGYGTIY